MKALAQSYGDLPIPITLIEHHVRQAFVPDGATPAWVLRYDHKGNVPFHDHAFHELVLVEAGDALHRTPHRNHEVRRGDALWVRPGVWHRYEVQKGGLRLAVPVPTWSFPDGDIEPDAAGTRRRPAGRHPNDGRRNRGARRHRRPQLPGPPLSPAIRSDPFGLPPARPRGGMKLETEVERSSRMIMRIMNRLTAPCCCYSQPIARRRARNPNLVGNVVDRARNKARDEDAMRRTQEGIPPCAEYACCPSPPCSPLS